MQLARATTSHLGLRAAAVLSSLHCSQSGVPRAVTTLGQDSKGAVGSLARQMTALLWFVPHRIDFYLRGENNGGKTGRNHFFSFLSFLSGWQVVT